MPFASCCNAESLVHGHEGEEADHDPESEEEIPVGFDHDEAHMLRGVLA